MTAFSIGSGPVQHDPIGAGRVDARAEGAKQAVGQSEDGGGLLFVNDALLEIEQGERLAEQAEALAAFVTSELESKDEAARALREEEAHEWIDPEALAEFLAETLQKDEETQRAREELVSDLQQGSPETMQQLLRERCGNNPTQLFVALQLAAGAARRGAAASYEDDAEQEGDGARRRVGAGGEDREALLDRLQDMTQELELSHGTRIRADLNTGGVWQMPETSRQLDAAEIVSLQAAYTTLVEGDARIASVLHRVLDGVSALRRGDDANGDTHATGSTVGKVGNTPVDDRHAAGAGTAAQAVLERFIQAVGRDIDALRPSVDREHLHALLTEKSHVITAITVLQQCDTLAATLHPQSPRHAEATALQTMRKAVALTEQSYFTPEAFVSFARTMASDVDHRPAAAVAAAADGVAAPGTGNVSPVLTRAIPFLTGFAVVIRDMPERVFADAQQRVRARDAVQHALDDLIDEENADV